jgi:diaminopropionate ammonia-lyase
MAGMNSCATYTDISNAEIRHVRNLRHSDCVAAPKDSGIFTARELEESLATISGWEGYSPTRLVALDGLAREAGVARIFYKDEGARFGLGSFKALGGAYAVSRLLDSLNGDKTNITVCSATDGNHGLSVAWGAAQLGCRAVIFIHAEVSAGRENALRERGAEVVRIDGNYDDSVHMCVEAARENGWHVVSDTTSDPNMQEIPKTVMAGYTVMATEVAQQLEGSRPTHVFIQGGVGGLAAAVCDYFCHAWAPDMPRIVIVEPELAPCLFESASRGKRTAIDIDKETMMAGLSCGEVSLVAWPVLEQRASDFLTVPDSVVAPTMRLLLDAPYGDPAVVAGESAIAGLAGFIAARNKSDLCGILGLDEESRVLVFGTEGATDPDLYRAITGRSLPGRTT